MTYKENINLIYKRKNILFEGLPAIVTIHALLSNSNAIGSGCGINGIAGNDGLIINYGNLIIETWILKLEGDWGELRNNSSGEITNNSSITISSGATLNNMG